MAIIKIYAICMVLFMVNIAIWMIWVNHKIRELEVDIARVMADIDELDKELEDIDCEIDELYSDTLIDDKENEE